VLRTVHHVDDFTTPALIDCQRRAIVEPDALLVVSHEWRRLLRKDYGVDAQVVRNGVDPDRFPPIPEETRDHLRAGVGGSTRQRPGGRPVVLAVGGVEPRKGSKELFTALGLLRHRGLDPVLVIAGGHSFQDYEAYRAEAMGLLPRLGLAEGRDVVRVGTLSDADLGAWFRSADVLAFPSTKEGFGLVALEALAVDLPVVASDLPVFAEFLRDGVDALLPPVGDQVALADALQRALTDTALRQRLIAGGRAVVPGFTWASTARRHAEIYARLVGG
jgi:glycosyltransferase-like protein